MKKIIALVIVLLMLPIEAGAEISTEMLDSLSEAEKTILLINVGTAIAKKETGEDGQKYSYHLDMDLMELTLEELSWLCEYLNGETNLPYESPQEDSALTRHGIEIDASDEQFKKSDRLAFCLYMTVADVCDKLGFAVQTHNPEVNFEPKDQHLTQAYFYINYFAEGHKDDLCAAVEEYTDVLLEAISTAYPSITIDTMVFCWQIPVIDKDSLYSAMFWCENDGNTILRGAGTGAAYQ